MNTPNQPPGGNGGRRPPSPAPGAVPGQPPQRPAAPPAEARPPQPQSQQPARPPQAQPRPTPATALPGRRQPPPQPPSAPARAPIRNGQAGAPVQAKPAPAQQPAAARPSRVAVNGGAPQPSRPGAVRPPVPAVQQQPQRPPQQRPPQPQAPQAAAPQATVRQQAAPPPPVPPPQNGRATSGAADPYPALVVTPLDGAPVVDPRPISARSPRAAAQPENVPMPSLLRPSRRTRNPFVIVGNLFLTLIFIIAVCGGGAFVIGKQRFEEPGPSTEDHIVNIPRGGIRDTADLLVREGVIDQPWLFIAGALMVKSQHDLKYGEYRFVKGASLKDVVDTIVDGKVVQHAFTMAEGLTSDQIVQKLSENDVLAGNIRDVPREGTLLPETYRFTRGTTREQMIKRMQADQRRVLQEVWERRSPDLPIKTPEQLVTLASIVEKETGKTEERTRVAAVFVNRLRQRMKLQSDPTIIYGLVGGKGSLGRPIMRSEIDQPTPYNTYTIEGLPPGPIANPGRASLEAAANPARTKELYFVADGTGGHAFADTYDQHQKNVQRLRALEQQARGAAAQPATAQPAPATRTR